MRHETLCFELATKFEHQQKGIVNLVDAVENLKTYTFINDLHMETYLPLQTATIAYEIGKGVVERKRADKYKEFFINKVIKTLERNCVKVIDPSIPDFQSRFRKFNYIIPDDV